MCRWWSRCWLTLDEDVDSVMNTMFSFPIHKQFPHRQNMRGCKDNLCTENHLMATCSFVFYNFLSFADTSSSVSELVNMHEATWRKLRASTVTNLSWIPHDQQEDGNILSRDETDMWVENLYFKQYKWDNSKQYFFFKVTHFMTISFWVDVVSFLFTQEFCFLKNPLCPTQYLFYLSGCWELTQLSFYSRSTRHLNICYSSIKQGGDED